MQYINDDRLFEDAHNHMINRLMHFKNLTNNEKIIYLHQSLQDFEQYYEQAYIARQKIQNFINNLQHEPPQIKEPPVNGGGGALPAGVLAQNP